MLWRCWLGISKNIRPVKIEWWGVVWLSVWSEVQIVCIWSAGASAIPKPHHLFSFKSRLVLPFWYQLTHIVLERRPFNWCNVAVVVFKIPENCLELLCSVFTVHFTPCVVVSWHRSGTDDWSYNGAVQVCLLLLQWCLCCVLCRQWKLWVTVKCSKQPRNRWKKQNCHESRSTRKTST